MVDIVVYTQRMAKPKRSEQGKRGVRELRAKVFQTGRSQAVRLPKEVRFEEDQSELRVRREGSRVILEPLDEWPEAFLAALGSCPDFPEPPERTPLREARDRFGR
jgi:antitoxin VapB